MNVNGENVKKNQKIKEIFEFIELTFFFLFQIFKEIANTRTLKQKKFI